MRRPVAAFVCALACAAVSASGVHAQQDAAAAARLSEEARARMAIFEALTGEWEGGGWFRMGQVPPDEFRQRETVRFSAGDEVLVIDGLGIDDGGDPVHQAFAMIAWDAEAGDYIMHAYSAGGGVLTNTPHVAADSLVWGFPEPRGGQIRFTIHFGDGQWHEVGDYSPDGSAWYRFMDMKLERVRAAQ